MNTFVKPRQRVMARIAVAAMCAALLIAGCDIHSPTEPGTLASIVVTPNVTLAIKASQQFVAVGKDADGKVVPISPAWSIESGGGAISATGQFVAGTTPGTYASTVKASSGGISGTANVTVTIGPLASITVSPTPDTLAITATRQYVAVGKDAGGNIVTIAPTWSVVQGGGAIDAAAMFTAGTVPGTFAGTVQASSKNIVGVATVTVTVGPLATIAVTPDTATLPINGPQQFIAVGKDAGGNVVAVAPAWSIAAGGGAVDTVGLFSAGVVPGTYMSTVKATKGTLSGTATVTVTIGPLSTITVSPNPDTLASNGTQQFTAVGKDAGGNVVAIAPAWSVVALGGAINSTGLFTAGVAAGAFANTVRAGSGSVAGLATVVVTAIIPPPPVLTTITVTPNPMTLAINGTQQYTAVGRDAGGNLFAITPTWSVVAGGGAINGTGLFTAGIVPGTFTNTVQATSGAVSGTATVTVTVGPLATITVTPNPITLAINGTQQYTAVGKDAGGNVVAMVPTWSVTASGGVINGTGLFTAGVVPGTYTNTVQATSGAIAGNATVTVTNGVLATITVTPNPMTLGINATQQYTAIGKDAGGNVVAIAPAWSVVAGGGAINGTGLFTAGTTPGTFTNTVQATSGVISGNATVTVIAGPLATITVTPNPMTLGINATQQYTAVGKDAGGNVLAIAPSWSVVAAGGAINGTGLFTAGTLPGTFTNTVQATSGVISGNATVTVIAGPLATITVTPNPITLAINGTQQYTAVGKDAGGNVLAIAPSWSVVAGGGVINGTGLFTAGVVPGTFTNTVRATSGVISGNATVTVTTGVLATIDVTPNPMTLSINGTQQYTAVGKDGGGNVVAITPTWSVVAGGGAINGTGLFTAGTTPGTFTNTVQATSGVISGNATVTVIAGPLATITVTPNPMTLGINATQQYTAVGKDAGGNVLAIAPSWSVVAGGGAINGTGLFTAGTSPGTFTNTVQATSGAIVGNATVTVTTGPLATIDVTPNPQTLSINGTQQYTAVGKDAGGNVLAIAPSWSVVAGGGAINGTGLFTAGTSPGTFTNTVQATSGAIVGNATVTVTTGPVATIDVTPNPQTLSINGTQQYTAVGKDAGGNVVAIAPSWSVVAGGGAINGTGLFTAGTTPGTFTNTVQATSGVIVGNATVTVTTGPVATIDVTPNPQTLSINGTQQYTAVGKDAGGNVVVITPTWSVVAGGGAINGTGLFTAGTTPGTFTNTVQATSGVIVGNATVTVVAGPVATIDVTPNPVTLTINGTQQYTAVGKDAGGNIVVITPTWSVVAGGGAINGTGLFTAGTTPGTFTNTVQATSGVIVGNATVTVVVGPVATIDVTPNPATMAISATQQFVAMGKDAGGNVVTITPTWSVVNGGGTINGTGLFTAGLVDSTYTNTVQATSGAISGNATVIISPPTPLIPLGVAGTYGVLAGSAIGCVGPAGTINADVGLTPGSAINGFVANCTITGTQHVADGPAVAAQNALTAAYDSLFALPCGNAIVADLGSTTKPAGVYCTAIDINVTGPLTLDGGGDKNATFVFQAGTALTTAGDIILINQAQAKNVYWLVGTSATLGTGSQWQGNVIALTSITLNDNVTIKGRALARNGAVTLGTGNVITLP